MASFCYCEMLMHQTTSKWTLHLLQMHTLRCYLQIIPFFSFISFEKKECFNGVTHTYTRAYISPHFHCFVHPSVKITSLVWMQITHTAFSPSLSLPFRITRYVRRWMFCQYQQVSQRNKWDEAVSEDCAHMLMLGFSSEHYTYVINVMLEILGSDPPNDTSTIFLGRVVL